MKNQMLISNVFTTRMPTDEQSLKFGTLTQGHYDFHYAQQHFMNQLEQVTAALKSENQNIKEVNVYDFVVFQGEKECNTRYILAGSIVATLK